MISRLGIVLLGIVLFASMISRGGMAKNLGTMGDIYPIQEPDFLTDIHQHLKAMKASGKLAEQQAIAKKTLIHSITDPKDLGLGVAEQTQVTTFTPSMTLTQPILVQGKILYPKGTTVRPLDHMKLHEVLLFFDATSQRQVAWAVKASKAYPFVKLILTGGNIAVMMKKFGRVYYDQDGTITQKLHITHVPAIVQQVGHHLQITFVGVSALPAGAMSPETVVTTEVRRAS